MTIKEMRAACGMTQASFSEYLNIPKRTIEDWESGRRAAPDYVTELIGYKLRKEGKMKIYTASRETGDFIEQFDTIEEARKAILAYEEEDKKDDCYEPNFYDVVNEEHCTL